MGPNGLEGRGCASRMMEDASGREVEGAMGHYVIKEGGWDYLYHV